MSWTSEGTHSLPCPPPSQEARFVPPAALMALYDEDLLKNPFYLALQKWRPDLCSKVAQAHGTVSILVPRVVGSWAWVWTWARLEVWSRGGFQGAPSSSVNEQQGIPGTPPEACWACCPSLTLFWALLGMPCRPLHSQGACLSLSLVGGL